MVRSNKNTNTNRMTLTVYVGEDRGPQLLGWGTPQLFAQIIALRTHSILSPSQTELYLVGRSKPI